MRPAIRPSRRRDDHCTNKSFHANACRGAPAAWFFAALHYKLDLGDLRKRQGMIDSDEHNFDDVTGSASEGR